MSDSDDLLRLLTLNVKESEIQDEFDRIASLLLNEYCIVVKPPDTSPLGLRYYEILELEFYLHAPDLHHKDPFTHQSDEQRLSGQW